MVIVVVGVVTLIVCVVWNGEGVIIVWICGGIVNVVTEIDVRVSVKRKWSFDILRSPGCTNL